VGFDTIDFGSFVSPKTIPQMQDTAEVLAQLDLSNKDRKLKEKFEALYLDLNNRKAANGL
jgi:hypothetical protein